MAITTIGTSAQKSPFVTCSTTIVPSSLPIIQPHEVITRPGHALIEVEKKEKRDGFDHIRHVVHFSKAYMNREKAEELNKLRVTEASERLIERDQNVNIVF